MSSDTTPAVLRPFQVSTCTLEVQSPRAVRVLRTKVEAMQVQAMSTTVLEPHTEAENFQKVISPPNITVIGWLAQIETESAVDEQPEILTLEEHRAAAYKTLTGKSPSPLYGQDMVQAPWPPRPILNRTFSGIVSSELGIGLGKGFDVEAQQTYSRVVDMTQTPVVDAEAQKTVMAQRRWSRIFGVFCFKKFNS